MDESVIKHLEQANAISLSSAIRAGHGLIGEERNHFLRDGCGCAIGAALAFRGYTNQDDLLKPANYRLTDFIGRIANMFGVPREVTLEASHLHFTGQKNRLQIADWLEAQGY